VTLVTQNADGSAQAADVPAKEVAAVVAEEAAKKTDETAANSAAIPSGELAFYDPEIQKVTNVGDRHRRVGETNALKFDGNQGSVLVVYSHRELGWGGGNSTIATLPDRASGRVRIVNLDGFKAGGDISAFLASQIGTESFAHIVLARHGGFDGTVDPRMGAFYDPGSALVAALGTRLNSGGSVWLDQCNGGAFALVNPDYLPGLSGSFGGAAIYYGTGNQQIFNDGLASRPWATPRSYESTYLDYQVYRPGS
jgi:hypothetical protein